MGSPFIRSWDAADPKAAVAIVHGLAEHSGRYEHVGLAFAGAGYSVRAVDISNADQVRAQKGEFDAMIHCASTRGGDADLYRRVYG